jgi:hypothetical protein
MSDASHASMSLRERLGTSTEERLGRAFSDLLDSPLLTGALSRAFDAREKAAQAQEVAMGALNLPSAADVERLTRRLRSVSLRLEGIEESIDRLERTLSNEGQPSEIAARLAAIEQQLARLSPEGPPRTRKAPRTGKPSRTAKAAAASKPSA